ncbi:YceD family protein [Olsenella massiliensis]|uniref:YceD family protein n=1 Tax=Olsenella massiliensis TaxID=1622075 RepID=UPI00071CBB83|nr:DUF177 domain-containing protein [Olsenella massiliensis]
MEQVRAVIDERLENPGDSLRVAGHLDEDGYRLGSHDFALPAGLSYDLMLTNAGDGILATGIVSARVTGSCDRCLGPAAFDVTGELDEYYLFREPEEGAEADEEDFSLVGDDHTVDLTEAIRSALLMDTPYIVLCDEDCKGLCPVCGANLNEGDCGHAELALRREERERLDAGPFSALRRLRPEEGDGESSDA